MLVIAFVRRYWLSQAGWQRHCWSRAERSGLTEERFIDTRSWKRNYLIPVKIEMTQGNSLGEADPN